MKKIEAIVRQEKYIDLQEALNEIDVQGITVYQVMGCGHQKGYTKVVRGNKVEINMLPKVKFEIVVSTDEWMKKTVDVIQKVAYTGNVGDGKIFIYDLDDVIRIRTGEHGIDAI